MKRFSSVPAVIFILALGAGLCPRVAFAGGEPKWLEVHTAHFSVLTDSDLKHAREVALRMEQMRTVFGQMLLREKLKMPVPVTVVALKSDNQYGEVAPTRQSKAAGFFVPGSDRVYIVLNLFEPEPWRAVAHPLAHYLLNYNYPPAQGWFDEGLAEYFGSLRVDDKQVESGADPELSPEWYEDIFEERRRIPNVPQSLTQLLNSPVWLSMTDLFSLKHDTSGQREGTHHTLYYAQSWMTIHYLVNREKMPETGTYFDLVLNQKVPVDKAMVKAFDLSPAQFEEAVRAYFKSLPSLDTAQDRVKSPDDQPSVPQPYHRVAPFGPDEVGMAVSEVKDVDARAVLGDIMARVPERRDQALRDLQRLTEDPKDNEGAQRALAWDAIVQKKFDAAGDYLDRAGELNSQDPWIWYYRAALKYRQAQVSHHEMQGLANMMQDLRAALDWYPELAEAYNMLGVARVEGGGINSALEAQKQAIALSPRNLEYQFNLGQIYVAGKKWDQARDVFTRLMSGPDSQAAQAAKKQLDDLASLQKYGIRPQRPGETNAPAGAASTPAAVYSTGSSDDDDDSEVKPAPPPAKPAAPVAVQFLKGKLVNSDCSKPPDAVLTVLVGMKTYKLHTADFKTLLVVGEDQFSCDWRNRVVAVNYKPSGKNEGEVVSVEVQ